MSGTKSSAIKHGTLTGYQQFHCRCDLCKEARRSYDRNRKEEDRSLAHHTKMGPWSARERNYVAETMDLPIRTVAEKPIFDKIITRSPGCATPSA